VRRSEGRAARRFTGAEESALVARVVKAAGLELALATFELGDEPLMMVPYEVKVE
jgi:hypothetical protein